MAGLLSLSQLQQVEQRELEADDSADQVASRLDVTSSRARVRRAREPKV